MEQAKRILPAHPVANDIGVANNNFKFVLFVTFVVIVFFLGGRFTMKVFAERSFNARMMMVCSLNYLL